MTAVVVRCLTPKLDREHALTNSRVCLTDDASDLVDSDLSETSLSEFDVEVLQYLGVPALRLVHPNNRKALHKNLGKLTTLLCLEHFDQNTWVAAAGISRETKGPVFQIVGEGGRLKAAALS